MNFMLYRSVVHFSKPFSLETTLWWSVCDVNNWKLQSSLSF